MCRRTSPCSTTACATTSRWARRAFSDEEVWRALRAAGADEFIEALPDGLDHVVGERGQMISGGQRQRIALARALLHRPAILILDEATAGLDRETEEDDLHPHPRDGGPGRVDGDRGHPRRGVARRWPTRIYKLADAKLSCRSSPARRPRWCRSPRPIRRLAPSRVPVTNILVLGETGQLARSLAALPWPAGFDLAFIGRRHLRDAGAPRRSAPRLTPR